MRVIPIFLLERKFNLKTANKKTGKKGLIIGIVAVALVAILALVLFFVNSADKQVENKIDVAAAQTIVDDTFASFPRSTAPGAKLIIDKTSVKVNSVEYGNEKDVILNCTYNTVDVNKVLTSNLGNIMTEVYGLYVNRENEGLKTSATNVKLFIVEVMTEYLENAEAVSGDITLRIYETNDGLKLYLNRDDINTCTGGLYNVYDEIRGITSVQYGAETIDITAKQSLRNGLEQCIEFEYMSFDKPSTKGPIEVWFEDLSKDFHKNFIEADRWKSILKGVGTTLSITALAVVMGVVLGFVVAVIRCTNQLTGKLYIPDKICQLYLTVTRGTPLMVQLLIIFFVVFPPLERALGINIDNFTAAVLCFGLNSGAYVAEIVRGGIMSVDKGQIEAGRSLGFTYVQTMVHFVIPQAFKAILPALANEFITLLKESSIAFYIGVADLNAAGNAIRAATYSAFMPLIAVAAIYLVMVLVLTKLVSILERRLAKSDH